MKRRPVKYVVGLFKNKTSGNKPNVAAAETFAFYGADDEPKAPALDSATGSTTPQRDSGNYEDEELCEQTEVLPVTNSQSQEMWDEDEWDSFDSNGEETELYENLKDNVAVFVADADANNVPPKAPALDSATGTILQRNSNKDCGDGELSEQTEVSPVAKLQVTQEMPPISPRSPLLPKQMSTEASPSFSGPSTSHDSGMTQPVSSPENSEDDWDEDEWDSFDDDDEETEPDDGLKYNAVSSCL